MRGHERNCEIFLRCCHDNPQRRAQRQSEALAKEHGLSAQEIMQRYFSRPSYEAREDAVPWNTSSSSAGCFLDDGCHYNTMDLDASLTVSEETVSTVMRDICSVNLGEMDTLHSSE